MLESESDLSLASGFERSSKSKDCDTNSAVDSGFISGPQAIYSGELDSALDDDLPAYSPKSKEPLHQQPKIQIDTNIDSGCLTDSEMISTGFEAGLPEWFNNLSLKNTPSINNLDGTKEKSNQSKNNNEAKLWQICYKQDNDGDTQLHLAIINEIPQMIWAIIRIAPAAWLLDLKNDDAQAPIHLAVLTRQPNVVRRLLVAGAKASIRDGDGNTALHLACINGDLNMVAAFLKPLTANEINEHNQSANQLPQSNVSRQISIDLEQKNFYGENCIHIAAHRNHLEVVKLLSQYGADINAREGRAGYTPLHIAVENDNLELAQFLLENNKQINAETLNYRRVTAYQIARELQHYEMIDSLEEHGCVVISPPESDYDSDESTDID